MSNEINNNVNAIELSEQELDMVAGGSSDFSTFGFGLNGSTFEQFALKAGESSFAGPEGTGTQNIVEIQGVSSKSFKGFGSFGDDTSYESYE